MSSVYILCEQVDNQLTPIGVELSEDAAKEMAGDGEYYIIPIQIGKRYENIIDPGIVYTVQFQNTSLKTMLQQARDTIQTINSRLNTLENQMDTVITQGQALQDAVADLDSRVTALEGSG